MRVGVRLGVDIGTVRIGVARSDALGTLAIPLETVRRDRRGEDLRRLAQLVQEREAIEVVIGLPLHLAGVEGKSARDARRFARHLQDMLPKVRVCLVDERLSSNQAHELLSARGLDSRRQRPIVDQVAAQIILEQALDFERSTGALPGEAVADGPSEERTTSG